LASGSSSDEEAAQGGNSSDDDTSRLRPDKRRAYLSLLDSLHSQGMGGGDGEGESSGIEMSFAGNVQRRAEDVLASLSSGPNGKSESKKNKKKEKQAEEDSLYVDDVEVSVLKLRVRQFFSTLCVFNLSFGLTFLDVTRVAVGSQRPVPRRRT
jgi:hypothetical protein